jgi:hypothetical protein
MNRKKITTGENSEVFLSTLTSWRPGEIMLGRIAIMTIYIKRKRWAWHP